jgi:hypothetical protein
MCVCVCVCVWPFRACQIVLPRPIAHVLVESEPVLRRIYTFVHIHTQFFLFRVLPSPIVLRMCSLRVSLYPDVYTHSYTYTHFFPFSDCSQDQVCVARACWERVCVSGRKLLQIQPRGTFWVFICVCVCVSVQIRMYILWCSWRERESLCIWEAIIANTAERYFLSIYLCVCVCVSVQIRMYILWCSWRERESVYLGGNYCKYSREVLFECVCVFLQIRMYIFGMLIERDSLSGFQLLQIKSYVHAYIDT